ncbi:hypothetical protein [Streptomyces sp. 058-1L]|uniref:hypothetical protein n=1 Tax=Streptomyces sp. 058-1L TaxID=2789266 RepID=UPI00397EADF5
MKETNTPETGSTGLTKDIEAPPLLQRRDHPGGPTRSGPLTSQADPPPAGAPDLPRTPSFATLLHQAIRTSKLSLERVQHRLTARGIRVSLTTLSY